jgi:DNA polymerase I-like protein with 3'-5' exonuclease and polymerase domains
MAVQTWIHEYDAVIIATIHDAIMIDCPDVHLEEVSARVQAEMQASGKAVFGDTVPFATDATFNKSWEGI